METIDTNWCLAAQLRARRRWAALCGAMLALLCFGQILPAAAQTATQREYELKAGVLYHIISYVEWPAAAFSNQPPEIHVGLLGHIPFANALKVLNGKVLHGRKLVVKEVSDIDQAADCQVLFIGASEKARLGEIIQGVKNKPILTVSEVEGFAERGGIVNLLAGPNRIVMEINRTMATQAQLELSSQLLKVARVVSSQG